MHTSAPEATHPQVVALSQLADLVSSPYVGVRQHLAEHPAATLEVLAILAEDRDEVVRRTAEFRLGRIDPARRRAS